MNPKVSVIVPVYNNQEYVVTCMNSLVCQTLRDIQIICINDGSTDNSSAVLHSFADKDPRVLVVDKKNGGYGVGINTGLDLAEGKYVTILESDDFADLDMLETLFNYAEAFDLEVVRANFYLYWAKKIKNDHLLELFGHHECDRVIDPSIRDNQHCFYAQPALWSAIYRTDFIRENNLRLLETPGAAYQDTAFNFKIWACAKRVMFVHKPFVHYRQDNEASSINNPGKVNNICLEYAEIRRWLKEERPDLHKSLAPVATKMMCDAYTWNTGRVAEEFRVPFAEQFGKELMAAEVAGELDPSLFEPGNLAVVRTVETDPKAFVDFLIKGKDPHHGFARVQRKAETLVQFAEHFGLRGAKDLVIDRLTSGHESEKSKLVDAIDNEMASRKEPKFITEAIVPEISVVLTVYNVEKVLRETLDSIFAQTFTKFELICINDGSTDSSLAILEEYARKDSRMTIVSQENGGVAHARNVGLRSANAPYTLILDSDDIFRFDMFEMLMKKAGRTDADLVVCSSCEYDGETYESTPTPWALKLDMVPENEVFSANDSKDTLFQAFMGWPWDRLYKTSFLKEASLEFPEDLANSEDGVFVYGILSRAQRISIVEDVLVKHRSTRKGSVSNSRDKNPECFYEASCRIKADLQQRGCYDDFARSFLNWALDYAIWNISTLTDSSAKKELAAKLVNGGYSELEVQEHPWPYFGLYGTKNHVGFNNLKRLANEG